MMARARVKDQSLLRELERFRGLLAEGDRIDEDEDAEIYSQADLDAHHANFLHSIRRMATLRARTAPAALGKAHALLRIMASQPELLEIDPGDDLLPSTLRDLEALTPP